MTTTGTKANKFSLWRWLLCIATLNHFDNGIHKVNGEWRCKRCGVKAGEL